MCAVPAGVVEGDVSESWKPEIEVFCMRRARWLPDTRIARHETVPYELFLAKLQ